MRNKYLVYCKHCDLHNPPASHYIGKARPKCKIHEANRLKAYNATPKGKAQSRARMAKYRSTDKGRASTQAYREANREASREYSKQHFQKYRAKYYAKCRAYQARKKNATPAWLTEDDFKLMESLYQQAIDLTYQTGILHHVDHIIPLNGENVCGLHVPSNLQVITATENLTKSNHLNKG